MFFLTGAGIRLGCMFFIVCLCWGSVLCFPAQAETTQAQARLVAENFLGYMGSSKTIASIHSIEENLLDASQPAIVSGWVMDLSDGGYVLIASSRNASPVKGYSFKNKYASLPLPYRQFVEQELELYARLEADSADTAVSLRTRQSIATHSLAENAWGFLLTWESGDNSGRRSLSYTPDTHLLTTHWNQGYPYNKFLPKIDGQNAVAGCVNIALAQVMKYHGFPAKGCGVATRLWNDQPLKAVLTHPYHWENMPDSPGMATAGYLQDEVALLVSDLAIVNQTSFGLGSSSASLHQDDFVRFFGYSSLISSMDNSDADVFFSTLKNQIDQELPVLLSFPGHMVVVDGYASDSTGRKFHVNMGWGGSGDDYYYLDQPVQGEGFDFQPNLEMIYNIKPCSIADCVACPRTDIDVAPGFNTLFSDIFISADRTIPFLMRLDVRDENGDDIVFSTRLSNSEVCTATITDDLLSIQVLSDSRNKAATVQITAEAAGKKVEADFVVMVADREVAFGKEQEIQGRFESQDDINTHWTILEGICTINGDRGYMNQGFFISVHNSQGQLVVAPTEGDGSFPAIQHDFPFDLYSITTSLGSDTKYYPYTQGEKQDYLIGVSSSNDDLDLSRIAGLMGIDLTKTAMLVPGDLNGDRLVNLEDKLLALKIMTGNGDAVAFGRSNDVDGDGRIGVEEALFWP